MLLVLDSSRLQIIKMQFQKIRPIQLGFIVIFIVAKLLFLLDLMVFCPKRSTSHEGSEKPRHQELLLINQT